MGERCFRCGFRAARSIGIGIGDKAEAGGLFDAALCWVPGNSHRPDRATVIGTLEGDDARAAGCRNHRAGDGFVRVRARMAEPDTAGGALRHQREQLLGKEDAGLVGGGEIAGSGLVGQRPVDGLGECGVAVAEAGRPPGGGEVEQIASIIAAQHRALAARHRLREKAQMSERGNAAAFAFVETGHSGSPPWTADQ